MNHTQIKDDRSLFFILQISTAAVLVSLSMLVSAEDPVTPNDIASPSQQLIDRSDKQRWTLYVDNDLFSINSSDRDYTGGLSLNLSGENLDKSPLSLAPAVQTIDRAIGLDRLYRNADYYLSNIELGLTVFTPGDIQSAQAQYNDRPYASLIYLSSTQEQILADQHTAWVSTLTIGALGLNAISGLQNSIHKATGSETPRGWDNQISRGGEPTLRYSFGRQKHMVFRSPNVSLSNSMRASVGYISEISYGVSLRLGRIRSPWWSFNPNQNQYAEKSKAEDPYARHKDELFFWTGFNAKARLYNALLQGQFKSSPVHYHANQLRPILLEAWLGVTKEFRNGLRLSYVYRTQTSEVKGGLADRMQRWGGLAISLPF